MTKIETGDISKFSNVKVEQRQDLRIFFTTDMKKGKDIIYLDLTTAGENMSVRLFGVDSVREVGIKNVSLNNIRWFGATDLKIYIEGSSRIHPSEVYLTNTHFYNSTGSEKHVIIERRLRTDFASIETYKYLGASSSIEINLPDTIDKDYKFTIFSRSSPLPNPPRPTSSPPPRPIPGPGGDFPNRDFPNRRREFRLCLRNPKKNMVLKIWGSEYTVYYDEKHKVVFNVIGSDHTLKLDSNITGINTTIYHLYGGAFNNSFEFNVFNQGNLIFPISFWSINQRVTAFGQNASVIVKDSTIPLRVGGRFGNFKLILMTKFARLKALTQRTEVIATMPNTRLILNSVSGTGNLTCNGENLSVLVLYVERPVFRRYNNGSRPIPPRNNFEYPFHIYEDEEIEEDNDEFIYNQPETYEEDEEEIETFEEERFEEDEDEIILRDEQPRHRPGLLLSGNAVYMLSNTNSIIGNLTVSNLILSSRVRGRGGFRYQRRRIFDIQYIPGSEHPYIIKNLKLLDENVTFRLNAYNTSVESLSGLVGKTTRLFCAPNLDQMKYRVWFPFTDQRKRGTTQGSLVLEKTIVDGDENTKCLAVKVTKNVNDYATSFLFSKDGMPPRPPSNNTRPMPGILNQAMVLKTAEEINSWSNKAQENATLLNFRILSLPEELSGKVTFDFTKFRYLRYVTITSNSSVKVALPAASLSKIRGITLINITLELTDADNWNGKVPFYFTVFNCAFANTVLKDKAIFTQVRNAVLDIDTYEELGSIKPQNLTVISRRSSKLSIGENKLIFCGKDIVIANNKPSVSVMSLGTLTISASGNNLPNVTVGGMLITIDGQWPTNYNGVTIVTQTPSMMRPIGRIEFNGQGQGRWRPGEERFRMMRGGANINIGSMDTFPFKLTGSAFINSTASTVTFPNMVDLRNGARIDSTANVKFTKIELGAHSSFGKIKDITLQGPTNLSGRTNRLSYVSINGEVDMTSYAKVDFRNSTIADGTTINIPFIMRSIPTISMFGRNESSSKVTVNFKYVGRGSSEYKTLLINGDDFASRQLDVICGNFDCTKWNMRFEGTTNFTSATLKPVCVERKFGGRGIIKNMCAALQFSPDVAKEKHTFLNTGLENWQLGLIAGAVILVVILSVVLGLYFCVFRNRKPSFDSVTNDSLIGAQLV
jgi:hypothetical protein